MIVELWQESQPRKDLYIHRLGTTVFNVRIKGPMKDAADGILMFDMSS